MAVHRMRSLVFFGLILVFTYSWRFFLPKDYQSAMVISQELLDQAAAQPEILYDSGSETSPISTSSSQSSEPSPYIAASTPEVESVSQPISSSSSSSSSTSSSTTTTTSQELSQETAIAIAESSEKPPVAEPTPQVLIEDNFPLAQKAHSKAELPPIPEWNRPPNPHVKEKTPLFIAFTRNWRLLQQTVVAWINAGWPAEDIYVIENTGTMHSNKLGHLSLQNPFFLNHTRLEMLGVNVIITPTLYTFAQLQNFFLWQAVEKDLDHYFWSHMDIVPITFEDMTYEENHYEGHKTIYDQAVEVLRQAQSPDPDPNASDPTKTWAMRFFAFDYLTLVNRVAFEAVGGFDTTIPFYHTDCDMYDRLAMAGYETNEPRHLMTTIGNDFDGTDRKGNGLIYDVANSLDDLIVLYRQKIDTKASFTDQTRPEDLEAAKMQEEATAAIYAASAAEHEAAKAAQEAANEAFHQKEMQEESAHAKIEVQAAQEQSQLDDKAQQIKTHEESAQSMGQFQAHDTETQQQNSQKDHLNTEERKEEPQRDTNPVPYKTGSSISSAKPGEFKVKRDFQTSDSARTTENTESKSSNLIPVVKNKSGTGKWVPDTPGSPDYFKLLEVTNSMVLAKYSQGGDGRNTWQRQQTGGQGEPYYRDPDGFDKAIGMTIQFGRRIYLEKWGTLECYLVATGVKKEDEWQQRNWENMPAIL